MDKTKFPYIRKIEPEEFVEYLNSKNVPQEKFNCPICGHEHFSLIDNMPISNSSDKDNHIVLQPVLPAFVYPEMNKVQKEIENKNLPKDYSNLSALSIGVLNQMSYREVLHLVCDNCGYIRTFSKSNVLQWLADRGRL